MDKIKFGLLSSKTNMCLPRKILSSCIELSNFVIPFFPIANKHIEKIIIPNFHTSLIEHILVLIYINSIYKFSRHTVLITTFIDYCECFFLN